MSWMFTLLSVVAKALGLGFLLIFLVALAALSLGLEKVWWALKFLSDVWILQAVAGAWIALAFERASAESTRKLDELNRVHDKRVSATKGVLKLIDGRLHATRRYLDTIENEKEVIGRERERYAEAVSEWNTEIKTYQISLLIDFDDSYYGLELDHHFLPKFSEIDGLLRRCRIEVQAGNALSKMTAARIQVLMADINHSSLEMMRRMLLIAKRDRELLDRRAPLQRGSIHLISYGDLFAALLGRRQQF